MKLTFATLLLLSSFFAQATEPTVYCRAVFTENGAKEIKNFTFKCDNYGYKATFESKSKRFYVSAFSEESCTPQLWLHDSKTNSASIGMVTTESRDKAFDVFTDRVVIAALAADIPRASVMGTNTVNKAVVGCSTNKASIPENIDN